ncbi:MAG TPA: NAD(P)-dependent oxidoreductase [Nitrospinota bacterium]|nr:NAD(P)-dependent oxidoreductase [Nitrospinota bacterium]
MKQRIGFIGLGLMGKPMAKNLLGAGYPLVVYNRTKRKMKELVEAGAESAKSPEELAKKSRVIITMISDPPALKEVVLGKNGVIHGVKNGSILIDMSTIAPTFTREVAQRLKKKGVEMLDAPVSGSVPGAIAGTLCIMVGGKKDAYDKSLKILKKMGKKIFYMGKSGMGSYMKLVVNLIAAIINQAMAEGLVLGTKAGVSPDLLLKVLSAGAGKAALIEVKGPAILKRNFKTNFALKHMYKDLHLILDAAEELQVPLPLTGRTLEIYRKALEKGLGEKDFCAIINMLEDWAGKKVRGKKK